MATVKVVDLLSRAGALLLDDDFVRWTPTELQYWLNDGYRELINLRPDASTASVEFACQAGARQVLTYADAARLLGVEYNTAATSKKYSVRLAARAALDSQRRQWRTEAQTVDIEQYLFDPLKPLEFEVYPPASASARLWIKYSAFPAAHTLTAAQLVNPSTAEVLRVSDSFANALLDYVLYRAYSKDGEDGNAGKAAAYYSAFRTAVGEKNQTDAVSQPGGAQ